MLTYYDKLLLEKSNSHTFHLWAVGDIFRMKNSSIPRRWQVIDVDENSKVICGKWMNVTCMVDFDNAEYLCHAHYSNNNEVKDGNTSIMPPKKSSFVFPTVNDKQVLEMN